MANLLHLGPLAALAALGLLAGIITTLGGLGGGLLLLLVLAAWWGDPALAVAVTAPALLLGNVHRLYLFRREAHWPTVGRFAAGAVPAAMVGGALLVAVPEWVIQVTLVGLTTLALARGFGWLRFEPPRGALTPAGAVVGLFTGASGGAGVLTAPVLLTTGLAGDAYIGTAAACAAAMHMGRITAYGATGLLDGNTLQLAAVAAATILAGNAVGKRLRQLTARLPQNSVEHVVLAACALMAVLGIR